MFQFTLWRMLFIGTSVSILLAAVRDEPSESAMRLTIGAIVGYSIPAFAVAFVAFLLSAPRGQSDSKSSVRKQSGVGKFWVFLLVGSLLSVMTLVCYSVTKEAILYTDGLATWIVPIAVLVGAGDVSGRYVFRRRTQRAAGDRSVHVNSSLVE